MSGKIEITSNAPQYSAAINDYITRFGLAVREGVHNEARFLGERLISFTPPRSQTQGRKAVERDIRRAFLGLRHFDSAPVNVIKGHDEYVRAFESGGSVYAVQKENWMPNANVADMSRFHQSRRDRRGRVKAPKESQAAGVTVIDKMAVPEDALEDYIAMVQDYVGQARGGWAAGVQYLGGHVAQWISRHVHSGAYQDGLDQADPFFEFQNNSTWASGDEDDRVLANAVRARVRDIRNKIAEGLPQFAKAA